MNPAIISLAFSLVDQAIQMIKEIKAQGGMTDAELSAHAEKQDLKNLDDIKALLAL